MEFYLKNCKHIVFSGGGVKGHAITGALQALRDTYNIDFGARTQPLEAVAGCSIGSIFALLIVLGYSVTELSIFSHYYFSTQNILTISSNINTCSLSDGIELRKILRSFLFKKDYSDTTTFKDVFERTGIRLIVTVTELETMTVHYMGHEECTITDMPVLDAVMASSALPLLFPAVEFNGKSYVDGGLLDNYPISLFPPNNLLGFLLRNEHIGTEKSFYNSCLRIHRGFSYIHSNLQWTFLPKEYKEKTVVVYLPSSVTVIGGDSKDSIVRAGYKCFKDYVAGKKGADEPICHPSYFKFLKKEDELQ